MRKIVKTILAVACFAGIILAGGENPDGSRRRRTTAR